MVEVVVVVVEVMLATWCGRHKGWQQLISNQEEEEGDGAGSVCIGFSSDGAIWREEGRGGGLTGGHNKWQEERRETPTQGVFPA